MVYEWERERERDRVIIITNTSIIIICLDQFIIPFSNAAFTAVMILALQEGGVGLCAACTVKSSDKKCYCPQYEPNVNWFELINEPIIIIHSLLRKGSGKQIFLVVKFLRIQYPKHTHNIQALNRHTDSHGNLPSSPPQKNKSHWSFRFMVECCNATAAWYY